MLINTLINTLINMLINVLINVLITLLVNMIIHLISKQMTTTVLCIHDHVQDEAIHMDHMDMEDKTFHKLKDQNNINHRTNQNIYRSSTRTRNTQSDTMPVVHSDFQTRVSNRVMLMDDDTMSSKNDQYR